MFGTTQNRAPFFMAILAVAAIAIIVLYTPAVESQASAIIERCASENDRASCYEREVSALYPGLSVAEVFTVVRGIREEDPSYQFCHVLAHKLGERVVAQDPSRWIEAMSQNPPDGLCSNGFLHGVIGGKFRAEVLTPQMLEELVPDFSRACEPREGWQPSALDQAMCYHGMGHLYMFITDAVIPEALSLCERTTLSPTGDFRRVCREGVFMQIYQPLEPDDFLLIEQMAVKPTKETVRKFCAQYEEDEYEGACLRESWPYFREDIINGSGIAAFCSGQPNSTEETACYESALSILGRQSLGNVSGARSACELVLEERKTMCYSRVALAIIEEDRAQPEAAIASCVAAPEPYASECINFLARLSHFNYIPGTPEYRAFCTALPETAGSGCDSVFR